MECRQAGAVAEQIADGELLLAGLSELRPVGGHRRINVEQALLDEAVCADGRDALRGREGIDDGVAFPRAISGSVGRAAPKVDDHPAVEHDGKRGADLAALGEVISKSVPDARKAGVAGAVDLDGSCHERFLPQRL